MSIISDSARRENNKLLVDIFNSPARRSILNTETAEEGILLVEGVEDVIILDLPVRMRMAQKYWEKSENPLKNVIYDCIVNGMVF